MCDWGWGYNGMAGWGGIGWILMAVFWIAVIGLIVWAVVRLSHGNRGPAQQGETPREILDRRFASGEIDADAYAEARGRLTEQRPGR
ncbi:MAG: SHOCT domain-containing protein [Pseudonocardia sp.]|jgi:putative membrane protein